MTEKKKYYCISCDRDITAVQKKNYRGLCPECASLVEVKKSLKLSISIGIVAVPLLSVLMLLALNLVVLLVEFLTSGDFFLKWVDFYLNYNFLNEAFEFFYHPIMFSLILGVYSYIVIFQGVRNKKGFVFYIASFLIWIIVAVIYVFLVITRFS